MLPTEIERNDFGVKLNHLVSPAKPIQTGACQAGCRVCHAAKGWVSMLLKCAVTTESRSGLSVTIPM